MKVNLRDHLVDFATCVALMDDTLREELHAALVQGVNEQMFLDAYAELHLRTFGVPFTI
jgi:hypothetical protein